MGELLISFSVYSWIDIFCGLSFIRQVYYFVKLLLAS